MASIAGLSSRIGTCAFGIQTTKGTAATATATAANSVKTVKAYFAAAPTVKPVRNEGRYSMTDSSRFQQGDPYTSSLTVAGQVQVYAHPELMGFLFDLVLGASAESGTYTHTVTAAATLPYFTMWKFMAGGVIERYTDCQANSLSISGAAGQPMQVTLDIVGISSTFLSSDPTSSVVDPSISIPFNFADGSGALRISEPAIAATVTIATPGVWTATASNFVAGDRVMFQTNGALPTGVLPNTIYFVLASGLTANSFQFALTAGGAAIATSGTQSGTHTVRRLVAYPLHAFDLSIANNLVPYFADNYVADAIDPQGLEISGSYSIRFASSTAAPLAYRDYFYAASQTAQGSGGTGTIQTISVGTQAMDFLWTAPSAGNTFEIQLPVVRWADLPVNPDPSGNVIEVQCAFEVMRAGFGVTGAHVENTPITVIAVDTIGAIATT